MPASDGPLEFAGRHGRYILLRDRQGLRHAVRYASILAVSDLDGGDDATAILLPGGRVLVVTASVDEVLAWLD